MTDAIETIEAEETTTETVPTAQPAPETPNGLDDGGVKALKAERDARKAAEAEVKRLREQLQDRDRADVIRTYQLPDGLADRLTGTTRDELEADAERLASLFKSATEPPAGRRPMERLRPGSTGTTEPVNDNDVADRIVSRGGLL